jgi:uroporphyrin-III C-methyltransferase
MTSLNGHRPRSGTVYLVGAGPGAADLLTLRAARLLGEAEVVFHDALVPQSIVDLASSARKIPVGKRCGRHSTAQRFINKRLADAAARHRVVVRLKGGDPMIFGRAHEEILYLRQRNVPVEIVPGVTAALGASAQLQVSLTRRGLSRSVVFATTRAAEAEPASSWLRAVMAADTAVLYMAAREAHVVKEALLAAGMPADRRVAVVQGATLEGTAAFSGHLRELDRLVARCAGGPSLLLIGEVLEAISTKAVDMSVESRHSTSSYAYDNVR